MSLELANKYIAGTFITKWSEFGLELGDCSEVPTLITEEYEGLTIKLLLEESAEIAAELHLKFYDEWVDTHPDDWQAILNAADDFDLDDTTRELVLTVSTHRVVPIINMYTS